jgi:hypothetical protein
MVTMIQTFVNTIQEAMAHGTDWSNRTIAATSPSVSLKRRLLWRVIQPPCSCLAYLALTAAVAVVESTT